MYLRDIHTTEQFEKEFLKPFVKNQTQETINKIKEQVYKEMPERYKEICWIIDWILDEM